MQYSFNSLKAGLVCGSVLFFVSAKAQIRHIHIHEQIITKPPEFIVHTKSSIDPGFSSMHVIHTHERVIDVDPGFTLHNGTITDPRVWFHLGFEAAGNGNYWDAITDYSNAIDLDSSYSEAYNYRGLALCHLENYGDALVDFESAIEINPKYASAYNSLGAIYEELDILKEAIQDYTKAVELDPGNRHYKKDLRNALEKDKEE